MNIEAVKQKSHKLGWYDLTYDEMNELLNEAKKGGIDETLDLITLSYTYGFIRGGNVERNKRNKQSKQIKTKECEETING